MKAINEMNTEELREELVNAKSQLAEATERAEKAEKEVESLKGAWQYQSNEICAMKEKIASLKTIIGLM